MRRVFLGIPISEELRGRISHLSKELQREGINLVKPENLHFTMKFLGEIDDKKIDLVTKAVKNTDLGKKFNININQLGCFPNQDYIKVIWLGVEDDEQIFDLHKKINFSLSKFFPVERDFLAHLTLARVKFVNDKQALKEFIKKHERIELGEMIVDKVILYESQLGPEGPVYTVLKEFCLK